MARSCTVCSSPRRREVDARLVEGASIRDVARRTSLSRAAIDRHARNHVRVAIERAREERSLQVAVGLAGCVRREHARLASALSEAIDVELELALPADESARSSRTSQRARHYLIDKALAPHHRAVPHAVGTSADEEKLAVVEIRRLLRELPRPGQGLARGRA